MCNHGVYKTLINVYRIELMFSNLVVEQVFNQYFYPNLQNITTVDGGVAGPNVEEKKLKGAWKKEVRRR